MFIFAFLNTEEETMPKDSIRIQLFGCELIVKHCEAPSATTKIASACAACTYLAVEGLGWLLVTSKDIFLKAMKTLFDKYNVDVEDVKRHCIKICLKVRQAEQLRDLSQSIETRQLHREICFAIANAGFREFGGKQYTLAFEHLCICLQTTDGETIDGSNWQMLYSPEENSGRNI